MNPTVSCAFCGAVLDEDEAVFFDDQYLCPDCLDAHTTICGCCGRKCWNEDINSDSNLSLCEHCYYSYYNRCARCNCIVHHYLEGGDDEEGYCSDCYAALRDQTIRSYYFKPEPIFYGDGPRYLGVELEIDGAGGRNDRAADLLRIANEDEDEERLYAKHDSSLDDGFELVSHPMTLAYHTQEMPWRQILERAVSFGYLSHQPGTCGLHVHVNCTAFGEVWEDQEAAISRVLFFVENHWNELLRFSRRTQRQIDRWAARYGRKDDPKQMMDHVKESGAGRYASVNLTNDATIEFRIFRGTLRYTNLSRHAAAGGRHL